MKLMIAKIRDHGWGFLLAIVFLTVEAVCDLLQPTMLSKIVDEGVAKGDTGLITQLALSMLGIALLGAMGAVGRNYFASNVSQRIGKELRGDLYRQVQRFSFENIDRLQPASLVTRMTNDVTQIQNFINGCMRIFVKAPITCLGAIVIIVWQMPGQIPVLAGVIAVSALLIWGNMKLGYPRFGRMQQRLDRLNQVSREYLNSVRVVKAFSRESYEQRHFDGAAQELAGASESAMRVNAVFSPLISLAVNLGIVLLLWLGGYRGGIPAGELMASVNYMTQILFAVGMISNILNTMVRAVASAQRVEEVLAEQPSMEEKGEKQLPAAPPAVAFEQVSFSYLGSSRQAVRDLNFTVKPGQMCGIIGPTGCGKSTLVNLIPRFYDATSGRVLVGGQDVRALDASSLRRAIAVVPQKALLFTGSIEDNLHWGNKDASREEVEQAARAACAHDFITGFAQGYETQLGQGGVNLSGGQKQRLCIARALLKHPSVLILDDCTSALDATTEAQVMRNIRSYASGITSFLISQRISSVMRADVVICMENGVIAGIGTHEQLMEYCGVYREIYRSQIGGEENGR